MYRTRLDPPPANGWTPPADVLVVGTEPGGRDVETDEEFRLVAPEPSQPALDLGTDTPKKGGLKLLIDGESAELIRRETQTGKIAITARLSTGVVRTFLVPPTRVEVVEDR